MLTVLRCWLLLWCLPVFCLAAEITPSDVYTQTVQLEKEIDLLKRFYKISAENPAPEIEADLKPHHVWQKAYVIQLKINVFRRKHGFPAFAPVIKEPEMKVHPRSSWEQVQRGLTELRIVKRYLDIPGEVSGPVAVTGKRSIDVFNKLNHLAYEMDTLNGEPITPSYVYAEVYRLNEDVNALLHKRNIVDNATPPARKTDAKPQDSLNAVFSLLAEIQRLQRAWGIETTDLSVFRKTENVVPSDVFNMVSMCLAELQTLKAQQGLNHSYTPPAEYQSNKTPAEVVQLLGYVTQKLRLLASAKEGQ